MKTIYHLAISRLKYNKGRSLLTIVAITLMTTLLMSIGSSALTIIRHQQLEIAENAEIIMQLSKALLQIRYLFLKITRM